MINYDLLQQSIDFYEKAGFRRVEAPWTVSEKILDLTKPFGREPMQLKHNDKCLVGSGEQSFLYMYIKGFLPPGKYQTVTPCFRDESFTLIHSKYFMKNELIITSASTDLMRELELAEVIETCMKFFRTVVPSKIEIERIKTEDGYDINCNGIEIGSYGIREVPGLKYIYATGLAEPRTSFSISL